MQDASSPDADPDQPGVNNTNPLATVFPAPPPFYKHFIPANQSRLESLQESARQNTESTEEADGDKDGGNKGPELGLDELPHDLRYLIPPKPPLDGKFRSFGEEFDVSGVIATTSSNLWAYPLNLTVREIRHIIPQTPYTP